MNIKRGMPTLAVLAGLTLSAVANDAANWPQFRGPNGLGIAPEQPVPLTFDGKKGENLLWKVKVPMGGASSPVVWGDKVFLTGGDQEKRFVYAFGTADGKLLWQQEVKWGKPKSKKKADDEESEEPELKDNVAANTVATDGKRVYATFGTGDVVALDAATGKKAWAFCLWPLDNSWGHSASLLLHKGRLIIQLDHNGGSGSALIALDADTGKEMWRAKRSAGESFKSPIIAETKDGTQIITATAGGMAGYDFEKGAELWSIPTGGTDDSPSPAYGNGIAISAHSGDSVYAVKTDSRGKVKPLWTLEEPVEVSSPLVLGDIAYVALETKIVALELATGKQLWEHEVDEKAYASLCAVGDKIFFISQGGDVLIFQAGKEFKELGKGKVGEGSDSTPAFAGGKIYIRGSSNLYCFGAK